MHTHRKSGGGQGKCSVFPKGIGYLPYTTRRWAERKLRSSPGWSLRRYCLWSTPGMVSWLLGWEKQLEGWPQLWGLVYEFVNREQRSSNRVTNIPWYMRIYAKPVTLEQSRGRSKQQTSPHYTWDRQAEACMKGWRSTGEQRTARKKRTICAYTTKMNIEERRSRDSRWEHWRSTSLSWADN